LLLIVQNYFYRFFQMFSWQQVNLSRVRLTCRRVCIVFRTVFTSRNNCRKIVPRYLRFLLDKSEFHFKNGIENVAYDVKYHCNVSISVHIMINHVIANLLFIFREFSDAAHCYLTYQLQSDEIKINYAIYIRYCHSLSIDKCDCVFA
jgi:hypothetical protein